MKGSVAIISGLPGHVLRACGTGRIAILCYGEEKLGYSEAEYHQWVLQEREGGDEAAGGQRCYRADRVVEV
jgi:hypothetical protein